MSKWKLTTLFHTRVVFTKCKSRVTSEFTRHPFQVSIQKITIGATFPAKKYCEKNLSATIGGFPWTLIYDTIIHYITTVPWNHQPCRFILIKYKTISYAKLSPKRTFHAQTFSIAASVKYLAAVTVVMKKFPRLILLVPLKYSRRIFKSILSLLKLKLKRNVAIEKYLSSQPLTHTSWHRQSWAKVNILKFD